MRKPKRKQEENRGDFQFGFCFATHPILTQTIKQLMCFVDEFVCVFLVYDKL